MEIVKKVLRQPAEISCIGICIAFALWGQTSVNVPARITEVEGVTEYRLTNGLTVLLAPDPSDATVTVNITYLVGGKQEGPGEAGMAHLLEHMLFKGTPTNRNVMNLLGKHGASSFNGRTNYEHTFYYE